ncbi:MAG: hypothetical protein V3R29_09265 [Candidatus Acidoferrales bacterium]
MILRRFVFGAKRRPNAGKELRTEVPSVRRPSASLRSDGVKEAMRLLRPIPVGEVARERL